MRIVLDEGAIIPTRAHAEDAGLDLYSPANVVVRPGKWAMIDTGVHMEIPKGYVGLLTSKSGLMVKRGITCRGTIDAGYTGSIRAVLFNGGVEKFLIHRGMKVTQLVIVPCLTPELEIVDKLDETDRNDGGFGSTGIW